MALIATPGPLGQAKPTYNVNHNLVTVPNTANNTATLKELLVCNTNAIDGTFSAFKVPTGGSPTTDNQILAEVTVKAKDTFVFEANLMLGQNEKLVVISLTSGAEFTYTASGVRVEAV